MYKKSILNHSNEKQRESRCYPWGGAYNFNKINKYKKDWNKPHALYIELLSAVVKTEQGLWHTLTRRSTHLSSILFSLNSQSSPEEVMQKRLSDFPPRPQATSQKLLFCNSPKRPERPSSGTGAGSCCAGMEWRNAWLGVKHREGRKCIVMVQWQWWEMKFAVFALPQMCIWGKEKS